MQVKDGSFTRWTPATDVDRVYDIEAIQWVNGGIALQLRPDAGKPENRSSDNLSVHWDSVVCCQVSYESYRPDCWISDPGDAWSFFVSTSSGYLASARADNPTLPDNLRHFAVIGTNMIVDVLAENYPEIEHLEKKNPEERGNRAMSDNKNEKALKDDELENVNAGMKVVVNDEDPEELSWWEKFLKILFKH